jgi:ABC-type multidrug transport system fused ATPase/permease subunit
LIAIPGDGAFLNNLKYLLEKSSIAKSFKLLPRKDQYKVFAVISLQFCLGLLDLLGVMAIGLLGTLSVTGLQSQDPGSRVATILRLLHISEIPFQIQAIIIGISAALLLVSRTLFSIFFTKRILKFFGRRGALISSNLVSRLLSQPLLTIQKNTTQQTLFALTEGVTILTLRIQATAVVMASDISLLFILSIGLLVIDPLTALATFLLFMPIGIILHRMLNVRARALGIESSSLIISSNQKIVEVFSSYRESVVRNRRDFYSREIGKIRLELADLSAEISFMPYISKYVIETSVVVGALMLSAVQFVLQDATHAVSTLAIFLAAGSRIAPAVLRLQQGSIQIVSNLGSATPTFEMIDLLGDSPMVENLVESLDTVHSGFCSEIQVVDLCFKYPSNPMPAISNITLTIPMGASVAIVGPSGAGKTTLIDILLGILDPDAGEVLLSGVPPLLAAAKWPGAVSYVPQDVAIVSGTIRENVSLGYPLEEATSEMVLKALRIANLDKFVNELPLGLETIVGENGSNMSGGQRQRLGIARAMFTQPHLLVLDEATSALDGDTEAKVSQAIQGLRGSTTVVMIAHRLSTVRNADIVVYMAEGTVIAKGTFEEVRAAVPDFDLQSRLMGL